MAIDMVVVHGISLPPGLFGSGDIENFFCGHLDFNANPAFASIAALKVSAHLLISRKTDPGQSFDWRYLDCLLTACSA